MIRKAVVIVPSEDDYKARIEAQEKAENKEVPDTAIMEMKGIAADESRKSRLHFSVSNTR